MKNKTIVHDRGSKRRRGVVLLLVLIVVAILALGGLAFAELMLVENNFAQVTSRQSQVRAFAESGAEVARQFLDRVPDDLQQAGGLYDNSAKFFNQVVADEKSPYDRGLFTVVAPKIDDTAITGPRYGLVDESTKINLAAILHFDQSAGTLSENDDGTEDPDVSEADNTKSHLMLMALPGMTDDVADNILDWIDADDTPRDEGVESDYYAALQPAYACRNAPPASIEELLLVKGVTPELLFGYDAAKMGYSKSDAITGAISGVNSDGSMDHGWAAYLTLWSAESTLNTDGTPKINLNQSDMPTLYSQLSAVMDPKWAQFIVAYRQGGGTADSGGNLDTTKLGSAVNTISSPLDLVSAPTVHLVLPGGNTTGGTGSQAGGSTPGGPAGGAGGAGGGTGGGRASATVVLANPFTSDSSAMGDYLPVLFDQCTTVSGTSIPGRININQAPRIVLMSIPGMTSDVADQIISNRVADTASASGSAKPDQACAAWPLIEGIVPLATMKSMIPYVNAGGSVYRAQVVGRFEKGSQPARLEVVLDSTQHPTQVVFWKDMTKLIGRFPGEVNSPTSDTPTTDK